MDSVHVQDAEMPALGIGTAPMRGTACRSAVETALAAGYRHVDTAQMYDNEAAVGRAIAASAVPREEVFLVTKVRRRNLAHDDVLTSVDASLDRLDVGTVDLLLIHAPSRTVPVEEPIAAMNELQEQGTVNSIGVSNFSVGQLQTAIDASTTPIVTNQVAYNPFTARDDLLEVCRAAEVALTAYSPLAKGGVVGTETLATIGERYGKTDAQVTLRWLLQQEPVVAIPKAARPAHIRENVDVFDFELTDDEMRRISDLQRT